MMENRRQVSFATLFSLLMGRKIVAIMGIIFTAFPMMFIPFTFILASSLKQPYEKYNFSEIEKNGKEKDAKITSIISLNNVSINGQHPQLISYKYEDIGTERSGKFETFDLDKTSNYNTGSNIKILVYQNQTMIKGLKPFLFPYYIFYLIPLVFAFIGIIFLWIGFAPALKIFNLYKTGIVKDAYIISINSIGGMLPFTWLNKDIRVNYYFFDEYGNKVYGESATTDLLMLNGKKTEDKVKIFVSEKNETRSCLVPQFEAMKYNWHVKAIKP